MIPDAVRAQKAMLADSGPATAEHVDRLGAGWLYDTKWDGIRALAFYEADTVTLVNRRGVDITFRYPDLERAFTALGDQDLVLDGEIIVFDPTTHRPEFRWAHQRDAFGKGRKLDIAKWAQSYPATFVAFDCLYDDGLDLRASRLDDRLTSLDLLGLGTQTPGIQRSLWTTNGHQMLATVEQFGLEGTIAKRLDSRYRAGRSSSWVKLKPKRSVSALVTGWEPGEGWRAEYFGALTIAVYDDAGNLIDLGKVGSGFTRNDLNLLDPLIKAQRPGDEPVLVVEVEYQERQPGTGVLRFPTFKGVRTDVAPADATTAQFEAGTIPRPARVTA